MNVLKQMEQRHSCRSFTGMPVEREALDYCADAARLAPSARNSQPWRLILVDDPETVKKVAEQTSDEEQKLNLFTKTAKAFAVFVNDGLNYTPVNRGKMKGDDYSKSDIGGMILAFTLAAEEKGIGSCIIGSFSADGVKKVLGIPEEKGLDLIIALGMPDEPGIPKKIRREREKTVSYNGW